MNAINARSFRSGNSVALRFPRGTGLEPDREWTIIREGDEYRVKPKADPADAKRRLQSLVDDLLALGPVAEAGRREDVEVPERPWRP